MRKLHIYFFSFTSLVIATISGQSQNYKYKISNRINIGSDGGWDYLIVDEPTQRLFVSHGMVTQVVDIKSGTLLSTIQDTKGVHGITIANDLKKGFISNGKDTSVTVFDLETLQTLTKIKVTGINPDAILYDPFSHMVFVYNGRSGNATVIDASNNTIIKTILLTGKPEFAVTDGKGKVYVNIEDRNSITVINTTTLKVEKIWSIAPGEEPTGLALDEKNHRLFAVCGNKTLVVVNTDNGKIVTTLAIGDGCDGVVFDKDKGRIFSSNGEGTMTVIQQENANSYKVLETLETKKGARTIALSQASHQLFLPTAEFGEVPSVTKDNPRPRPTIKPNSFTILVID